MTQNALNAVNSFATIQQATPTRQQVLPGEQGPQVATAKDSLSFTVVSSNSQQVVLQDNANQQRFVLPSKAFAEQGGAQVTVQSGQDLATQQFQQTMPKKGDTLVLLSANEQNIRFRLIPASVANNVTPTNASNGKLASAGNAVLPAKYNRILVDSWPDVKLSAISKIGLNIVAQSTLALNSQSTTALSKALTQNAVKLGQPLIELALSGQIKSLKASTSTNPIAQLQVVLNTNSGQKINITLPIPKTAESKIKVGSSVDTLLSPNNKDASIQAVKIQSIPKFNSRDIKLSNELNPQLNQRVQQLAESSLLNLNTIKNRASRSAEGILLQAIPKSVLKALPEALSTSVKSAMSAKQVEDARLLVLPQQALDDVNFAKQSEQSRISLVVIAKPQIVNLAPSALSSTSKEQLLSATELTKEPLAPGSNEKIAKTAGNIDSNKNVISNDRRITSTDLPAELQSRQSIAQTQKSSGELLTKIKQVISAAEISALSPKIKSALNHTLSHTEPSAPLFQDIKQSVDSVLKSAGSDTKTLLEPLSKQLSLLLGIKVPIEQSNANEANTPNPSKDGIGEPTEDIQSLLRSTLSAQAVTSLMQNAPTGNQNNLIEGLVSLLKINLASKLASSGQFSGLPPTLKTGEIAPPVLAFASSVIKQNKNTERVNPIRVLQDMAIGDPRGNLIAQIGKLLSSHNTQKLRSADASLQGQDTFYYSFPNILNTHHEDTVMMLKRQHTSEEDKQGKAIVATKWSLNMKLDIGELGEVLAKTSFTLKPEETESDQGLDLHLYASNEGLKAKVLKYLPILEKRLLALGIQIKSQKCYIGKADPALFKTQLNVMNTYA